MASISAIAKELCVPLGLPSYSRVHTELEGDSQLNMMVMADLPQTTMSGRLSVQKMCCGKE